MEDTARTQSEHLVEPVNELDHALGHANAPITIVEYGDYECPDCFNAVPVIEEVRKNLGDRLRFVFRHFPQNSIHPHASTAAEAAEAAGEQGKFWAMHAALFKHQKELATLDFAHLALSIGLEIYKFESSRGLDRHRLRIRNDSQSGLRSGVKGTPTLFINNRRYRGAIQASAIVESALAAVA